MRIYYIPPDPPEGFISKVKRKYSRMRKARLEKRIEKLKEGIKKKKEELVRINGNALDAQIKIDELPDKRPLEDEEESKKFLELKFKLNSKLSKAMERSERIREIIQEKEGQKEECSKALEKFSQEN
jgi:hypothetical protein